MASPAVAIPSSRMGNDSGRGWRTYRRLLTYAGHHRRMIALAVAGMLLDAACTTLFAKLIKPLLDRLFIDKDPHLVFWMPIWIVGIFGIRGMASFAADYGTAYVGRSVVQTLAQEVFAAYLRLPVAFFGTEPRGQQIARVTYTCEQVAQASTDAVKVALVDGLTIVGLVGVMVYYSPYLTLVLLLILPAVASIATAAGRIYRRIGQRMQQAMGTVTGAVDEVVLGHDEVRVYGGQAREQERFGEISGRTRQLALHVAATAGAATALVQLSAALGLALILFLATRPAQLASLSPGTFFAVLLAMGGILPSLKRLTTVQTNIQRGLVAAQDLFSVLDEPAEPDRGTRVLVRAHGELQFEQVGFTYRGGDAAVLECIELRCPPGTVTALVGRSGSGKTTLAGMIPRLHDPSNGRILLDGTDVRELSLASLRRQIAWVGQAVALFDDTVAGNIAYGELAGASEHAIREAARAAHALAFIERLPRGLHTRIGQDGAMLSGGERQRIAIARAILKDAPILILDEATASLDAESERLIQEALARLMRQRTTLVVAHRLSTIQNADQIAVMDHGRLVERGTHASLLAASGTYARLHRMQFR